MTGTPSGVRWPVAVLAGAGLLAAGIAIGAVAWRQAPPEAASPPTAVAVADHADHADHAASMAATDASEPSVMLTPDMVERAGIATVAASSASASASLRIPGTVQPNAYKEIVVTSLAPGRVTQVHAQLGDRVTRGRALATIYSPELAEAQADFLGMQAELAAHDQRLGRAERLGSIGAVSRQEVDEVLAGHTRMRTALGGARSRLLLLGMTEQTIEDLADKPDVASTLEVPAPLTGVVLERNANPGANIDVTTPLFKVADLSTVWVLADVYERDLASVTVGMPVHITSPAYPGVTIDGKVSYLDPQVQLDTRTAKVRIEAPNPSGQLRLGMFVDVAVDTGGTAGAVLVPRAAIQSRGAASVVYLATEHAGHFVEREVHLGRQSAESVEVLYGIQPGDRVVTEGAFFLRSERERAGRP